MLSSTFDCCSYVLIELHARNFRLVVCLWKPFRRFFIYFRKQWDIKTSVIEVFGTFLLLSNVKFLSVSFDLLTPTEVHSINGSSLGLFLYYDASIAYFGKEHLPYAVLALLLLLIFVLLPMLLLLYPMRCFQRCLGLCGVRWHALPIFIDAFQGCYKDGTNGTCDCRYFAALYLITRFTLFVMYAFTVDVLFYAVGQFLLIVFAVLIAIIQPYKAQFAVYNKVDTVFILLLALWYCTVTCLELASLKDHRYQYSSQVVSAVVAVLPLFYITAITLQWVCSRTRIAHVIRKIQGRIHYQLLQLQGTNNEDTLPHRLSNPEQYSTSLEDPVATDKTENSCSYNSSDNETAY